MIADFLSHLVMRVATRLRGSLSLTPQKPGLVPCVQKGYKLTLRNSCVIDTEGSERLAPIGPQRFLVFVGLLVFCVSALPS